MMLYVDIETGTYGVAGDIRIIEVPDWNTDYFCEGLTDDQRTHLAVNFGKRV